MSQNYHWQEKVYVVPQSRDPTNLPILRVLTIEENIRNMEDMVRGQLFVDWGFGTSVPVPIASEFPILWHAKQSIGPNKNSLLR